MISNSDIRKIVRKLRISSGDVVLVKGGTELAQYMFDNMNEVRDVFRRANIVNVLVIAAEDLDDIKALSEPEMAQHGWYRGSKISKLLLKRVQQEEDIKDDEEG